MSILFFARTGGSRDDNLDTLPLPESPQPEESIPPSQPTDAFMLSEYVPPDSPEAENVDNTCPPERTDKVDKLPIPLLCYMCMLDAPCYFALCSWGC